MAATQYQLFVRYLNENIGKPLTNKTSVEWISAEELVELKEFYKTNSTKYTTIKNDLISGVIKESALTLLELNIYQQCNRYLDITKRLQDNDGSIVNELCEIRSYDSLYSDSNGQKKKAAKQLDLEMYQNVIDESIASNPKYDMIFMYDGIAHITFPGYDGDPTKIDKNPPTSDVKVAPEIYYERFKRIKLDPWFLHSTYTSLRTVMSKAEELVSFLGKDAVKIGKVVPLDQYIEII